MKIGDIARCKITGYEGVVIGHTRSISNVDRFTVQPREVKDGKAIQSRTFDLGALEYVGESGVAVAALDRVAEPAEVGDTVSVSLTGLEGVVTAITHWIEGCFVLNIQPRELKDGLPVEATAADERSVQVIARANPKPAPVRTGGPRAEPQRARQ